MEDQLDEELRDRIKKVFNEYEDPSGEEGWLLLRKKYPAKDRRRKDLKFQLNVEINDAMPVVAVSSAASLDVQDILKMMKTLPPLQAAIFNLYEVDGYSHDEISVLLSIPVSSSRVYLSRAKEKLRSLIRSEEIKHGRSVR